MILCFPHIAQPCFQYTTVNDAGKVCIYLRYKKFLPSILWCLFSSFASLEITFFKRYEFFFFLSNMLSQRQRWAVWWSALFPYSKKILGSRTQQREGLRQDLDVRVASTLDSGCTCHLGLSLLKGLL